MANVSILILTLNEEINVGKCLASVKWSDDVVVLDSLSKDRTVEISNEMSARVVSRKFDNWAAHQNWAMTNIPFKNPWVFYLDADEIMTDELRDEVLAIANDANDRRVAFYCGRKNYFMGRWLRHAMPPGMIMRFFRPEKIRFERLVNPTPVIDGEHGYLRHMFLHFNFSKGIGAWFLKHNDYAQMEAMEGVKVMGGELGNIIEIAKRVRGQDKAARRKALKALSFYVPFRAFARFVVMFFLKRGFLDGAAGFHYACMISVYEYWIALKMEEQQAHWRKRTAKLVGRMLEEDAGANQVDAVDVPPPPLVEVMIPTYNEADHIAEAVRNAALLGPVFVLDSFSTDGTQDLARAAGATVLERKFTNYGDQKNWGLDNLPFRGQWVFILDADERLTPALRKEIAAQVGAPRAPAGFLVNRLPIFMGRPVRHGGLFPSWNLRLFKRGRARYEDRTVHEHMVCQGRVESLRECMLHIRRETMSRYIEKHIRYAELESNEWVKQRTGQSREGKSASLFNDLLKYRNWVRRELWPRTPFRPLLRFFYMYFFRFGFMDGEAGWHLAKLMACYEYQIGLLYKEKLAEARGMKQG